MLNKAAAAPKTITGWFSGSVARAAALPTTVTGSFNNRIAGRASKRRAAVQSSRYSSYPDRLGAGRLLLSDTLGSKLIGARCRRYQDSEAHGKDDKRRQRCSRSYQRFISGCA